ncbi:MAG: PUA domain-containing protein [Candidatus Heimdallarchaeaceae archaeon]|jgi:7-cyano-7-deazaguanine tRNA-ribosyltransferase
MQKVEPTNLELRRIRSIADFQFGKGSGDVLFPNDIRIERSKETKRIRFIYFENQRICSFRVQDGYLIPSLWGGKLLHENGFGLKVKANLEAEPFIRKGKTLFAKHVIEADNRISVKDEVIIVNSKNDYIGIGTAKLSGHLMIDMKNGVAVETRKGVEDT